eukprot:TRINITY_DN9703_c0_g3_i1.p1 TRINITY_DN9703_c0_g3~~TRINITY_DN9703_c0_g3_i1.p1  ORF type:complete len:1050 (+),score=239.96 TRINITY_DN9703_c0_g3_i1:66-3152(+)
MPCAVATLRNVNVLLVVVCVAVSSGICTWLSTESGDRAVRKATDTSTESVSVCFKAGSENGQVLGAEIMEQVATRVMEYAERFTREPTRLLQQLTFFMAAHHPSKSTDWQWQTEVLSPLLWSSLQQSLPGGITMVGHMNTKMQARTIFEADDTLGPPYDAFPTGPHSIAKSHDIQLASNNGTEFGSPCSGGVCRTVVGQAQDYDGDHLKGTGGYAPGYAPCTTNVSVGDGRGFTKAACPLPHVDPAREGWWLLGYGAVPLGDRVGEPRWSSLAEIASYSVYIAVSAYTHPAADGKLGVLFVAVETSQIREFFRRIVVSRDGAPSALRVYAVQASDWLGGGTEGRLAGTSHGAGVRFIVKYDSARGRESATAQPLLDVNATDSGIRSVARHARTIGGRAETTVCRMTIPEEHAADEPPCRLQPADGSDGYAAMAAHEGLYEAVLEADECTDDAGGQLADIATGCDVLMHECSALRGAAYCCGYDLSAGPPPPSAYPTGVPELIPRRKYVAAQSKFRPGTTVADLCPATCRRCSASPAVHRYLIRAARFSDGYGLDWWVVLALDRGYVYSAIEAQTERAAADIAEMAAVIDEERKEDRVVVVAYAAGLAAGLCAVAMVCSHAVARPIRVLGERMRRVAMMDLDVETGDESVLSEVREMQTSFHVMVYCIRRYKAFLPQSVLGGGGDSEPSTDSESTPPPQMIVPSRSRTESIARDLVPSADRTTPAGVEAAKVDRALRHSTTRRRVTLVATGFRRWLGTLALLPDCVFIEATGVILSSLLSAASSSKGVLDTFSGDRSVVSFNAAKHCATHKPSAVRASLSILELSDRWRERPSELTSSDAEAAPADSVPEICLGVCSGDAKVGILGCDGLKQFTHVTAVFPYACGLERLDAALGLGCLCDGSVHAETDSSFLYRWIGDACMPKRNEAPQPVYQVCGEPVVDNDEWMYQMEAAAAAVSEYSHWRDAVGCVLDGDWDAAADHLQRCLELCQGPTPDPHSNFAAQRSARAHALLRRWVSSQETPEPTHLTLL